jgi:hypothetical protein
MLRLEAERRLQVRHRVVGPAGLEVERRQPGRVSWSSGSSSIRLLRDGDAVEEPGWQGARREHTGSIRPTRNAARQDGSAARNVKLFFTGPSVLWETGGRRQESREGFAIIRSVGVTGVAGF